MQAIREVPSARTLPKIVAKVGAEIEREAVGQKAGRQAARHVKIEPIVSPKHTLVDRLQHELI